MHGGVAGEAYNLCSGLAHSLQAAVEELLRLAHVDAAIEPDAERVRETDTPEVYGSHAKFHEATGWEPKLSFGQLLADLLDYWRAQLKQA